MSSSAVRRVTLRRSIVLVALAGIIPVAIAAAAAEWAFILQAERSTEAKSAEVTRIASSAIDVELQQSLYTLQGIALSPLLDEPADLKRFRAMLDRFIQGAPGWTAISLATPDQRVLLSTTSDDASSLRIFDTWSFERLVRTRASVVGRIVQRAHGEWGIALRVPVIRDGELKYVLSAVQSPARFRAIVEQQGMPADWVMSIFDSTGARVARSREHDATVGGKASPSLTQLMSSGAMTGSGMTYSLEGVRGYTSFMRLPNSHWSVAVAIPAATVWAGAIRPAQLYLFGLAVALLVGFLVARAAADRIARPIADMGRLAIEVGKGHIPALPDIPIIEIATLGQALTSAAQARQRIEQERSAVEDERNALLESERAARSEAVRMGALKDQFLATLSHELRTPLNSILGWAEILRHAKASDADRQRGLEIIERNARAQTKLVEDLLDVNRITSGKIQLDLQRLEPATAVRAAIDFARPAAAAKGVRLEEQIDMSAGRIYADPARLQQIMGNLLGNAIKFTPSGGEVRVRLSEQQSRIRIVVSDTGEGIAAEFLPIIFDRFRQADPSTTRKHAGLGLGLSIVRDLVSLHGGTVDVASAGPGQGATFTVELPLAISDPRLPHVPAPAFAISDLRGIRVLVVDDDEDARALAVRLLEEGGANVTATSSAQAALQVLGERSIDILVTDISMPEVDGYEFLRRVRALAKAEVRDIPAIALTAFARDEDRDQALAAGFAAHVAKPIEPALLTHQIARLARRVA